MRIKCPICGERDIREFTCIGTEAYLDRPDSDEWAPEWNNHLHLRDNPAGVTRELWYHHAGCGSYLLVERDTVTHDILRVELARDAKLERA